MQIEWSANQLSLVTGIDRRTVVKRLMEITPKEETTNGKIYLAPACFQAIMTVEKKRQGAAERLAIANANRAERKDLVEAGNTITIDRAEAAWEDLVILFKQRSLNVGNNLESQGKINHDQRVALDYEIKSALSELSKEISYRADKEEKDNGRTTKASS